MLFLLLIEKNFITFRLIPEEPGKSSCAVCRKKFRMKSSLRRHVIESEHTIAERTPESLLVNMFFVLFFMSFCYNIIM